MLCGGVLVCENRIRSILRRLKQKRTFKRLAVNYIETNVIWRKFPSFFKVGLLYFWRADFLRFFLDLSFFLLMCKV